MSGIESIGLQVVEWFQSWGRPVLWYLLYPFNYIGSEYGYLVLLPLLYWSVSKYHGKRLMVLALSTALVNTFLKFVLVRPRPYQVAPQSVIPIAAEPGFGIPSGHTVFGTSVAGYAWYRKPGLWLRVAAVAFALLMGVSRVVHGVHFPQDVIAGWILGAALVAIFWIVDTRYSDRMTQWAFSAKLGLTLAITAAAFVLALLLVDDYEGRKSILVIVGGLSGALVGFAVEHCWVRFDSGGTVGRRIARGAVGFATTVAIYIGLDFLYDVVVGEAIGAGALVIYVIRYAIVSFWAAAGAPALFRTTRLADEE